MKNKKTILLTSCGLFPQVITEVIYALTQKCDVDNLVEVHVITTDVGLKKIRDYLLDEKHGYFYGLCEEYSLGNVKFDSDTIHILKDHNGARLNDIRTIEDNEVVANQITELVRHLTSDSAKRLHVSLVGGRRTASYFLGYAISLFGRQDDELSQIIVCNDFQGDQEFFYPNKEPTYITDDKDGDVLNTQDANIQLSYIPFVRLREGLPSSLLEGEVTFVEAVSSIQGFSQKGNVTIEMEGKFIFLGSHKIIFSPTLFAWYSWLLTLKKEKNAYLTLHDNLHLEFIEYLKKLFGECHNSVESAEKSLKHGFDTNYVSEKNSLVNKKIKTKLGLNHYLFTIKSSGERNKTQYSVPVDRENIDIN